MTRVLDMNDFYISENVLKETIQKGLIPIPNKKVEMKISLNYPVENSKIQLCFPSRLSYTCFLYELIGSINMILSNKMY